MGSSSTRPADPAALPLAPHRSGMDNETAAVQQRLFEHQNPLKCEAAQFALWWPADSGLGWTMATAGGGRAAEGGEGGRLGGRWRGVVSVMIGVGLGG